MFAVSVIGDRDGSYDVSANPVVFVRTDGWGSEDYETEMHHHLVVLSGDGRFDTPYTEENARHDSHVTGFGLRIVLADWPPSEDTERFLAIGRRLVEEIRGLGSSPYHVGRIPPAGGEEGKP
jgi:hypothetical protein